MLLQKFFCGLVKDMLSILYIPSCRPKHFPQFVFSS